LPEKQTKTFAYLMNRYILPQFFKILLDLRLGHGTKSDYTMASVGGIAITDHELKQENIWLAVSLTNGPLAI
jgi:hypothetical protein